MRWEKKRQRHPEINGDTQRVPVGYQAPNPLRLSAETQFVAQPDRNRIWDYPPETSAGWKLHIGSGFGIAVARVYDVLQYHEGAVCLVRRLRGDLRQVLGWMAFTPYMRLFSTSQHAVVYSVPHPAQLWHA